MTQPQITESWQVVTAAQIVVRTFGTEDHATDWLRIRKSELPGAYVEKQTVTTVRQRVYTPRLRVAA
jgi:methylmalonyl-CoA mutase N-terminal domain/subunit